MSDIQEKMKQRVLDIINPDINYTQEDFNKEFGDINSFHYTNDAYKLQFNFVNESTNPNPEYATEGSSGFDLRANLQDSIVIEAGDRYIVPTGLYFEIPLNFEIQIRPRSGLAAKNGITVLNTPGTIDADYRGELKVILINHSKEAFTVNHGDRIAQAVITSVINKTVVKLNHIPEISKDTQRAASGFGSTGIK